jgi:DNA-binding MarR family transcriptional regulator
MKPIREELQLFVRRFGLLNASCCEVCCGEEISIVQSHILFEVRRTGAPSMQQVADELGMDVTTFSRQIKSLVSKHLVVRRVSSDDRRVSLLELTPEGEGVMARIDSFMTDRIEQVFSSMTSFERDAVTRSLELLNGALERTTCCAVLQNNKIACCK